MSEEDFLKKYNLKKAENTEDYQIDNETLIKKLKKENEKLKAELDLLEDNRIYLNNKIDKALEYIEKHKRNVYDTFGEGIVFGEMGGIQEILNILKGGKNDK